MIVNYEISQAIRELFAVHKKNNYACYDLVSKKAFEVLKAINYLAKEHVTPTLTIYIFKNRIVSTTRR